MRRTDDLDEAILSALERDSRLPVTGLAKRLRVARSTVQQRLARLERDGEIEAYTIRRRPPASAGVLAHVSITITAGREDDLIRTLQVAEGVEAIYTVSGHADLIVITRAPDAAALDAVLDRIRASAGVADTTTSVVLSVKHDRR